MIAVPADYVAPPLMGDLVRRNVTPEIIRSPAGPEKLSSLRCVDECDVRHEYQRGPCLTKIRRGLLRHRYSCIRKLAKKEVVDARGILRVSKCGVSHLGGRNRAQRGHRLITRTLSLFDHQLDLLELVRHLFVSVKLHRIAGIFVGNLLFLESAVVESRDGEFSCTARPFGYGNIAFARIRNNRSAGADKSKGFRI